MVFTEGRSAARVSMPATTNKQQALAHALTVIKKKYPPLPPPAEETPPRPVMEELVYALMREGVPTETADATFAAFKQHFYDWNEVRVSTVQEVTDTLGALPNAGGRAKRIIEFLQELFEMTYSFSLDDLEKKGLKQAAKQIGRYQALSDNDFAVAWVVQRSLGGHAVPLDEPVQRVLKRLHVIDPETEDDKETIRATIEHYVPKAKGLEFTESMSQFAAEICTEKNPACKVCVLRNECPSAAYFLALAKKVVEKVKEKEKEKDKDVKLKKPR